MKREQFNYIYEIYCDSDINNIIMIEIDNHGPVYFNNYLKTVGNGIQVTDTPILDSNSEPTGDYITGFLIYGSVAPSGAEYPQQKAEWWIPVEIIQQVGWVKTDPPTYVTQEPVVTP